MRSSARKPEFFSAYPLKALKQVTCDEPDSPYLKGLLSGKKEQPGGRLRVLHRVDAIMKPYSPVHVDINKLPKDIELSSTDWFNNYE